MNIKLSWMRKRDLLVINDAIFGTAAFSKAASSPSVSITSLYVVPVCLTLASNLWISSG